MNIEYRVASGKHKGQIFTPHPYADGTYVISKTRYEVDQIRVRSIAEIKRYVDLGYSVRMSHPKAQTNPTLITPKSIQVT